MALGDQISAVDYVAIQDKAQSILGAGIGSRGYGQSISSSDVFTGNRITKEQWDLLRYDIVNIRMHQDGEMPAIVTVNIGDPVRYGAAAPNTNYNSLLETAIANRFNIASNQTVVSAAASQIYSSAWSTSAQTTLTATFSTADQARYFFNSGGKFRVTTTLTGSTGTPQNNAWINFLNSAGPQSFGAATSDLANFYSLTNSYQTVYQGTLTTPYSANSYRLEAKSNVANNSTGTATVIDLRITLSDSYVGSGDSVNGTLTIAIDEIKAAGSLIPTGTFTITSPSYSLSAIAAA